MCSQNEGYLVGSEDTQLQTEKTKSEIATGTFWPTQTKVHSNDDQAARHRQ